MVSLVFVVLFHKITQPRAPPSVASTIVVHDHNMGDIPIFMYFTQMCLLFVGPEAWIAWTSVFNMNIMVTTDCPMPI
jgi:hypothetical protein